MSILSGPPHPIVSCLRPPPGCLLAIAFVLSHRTNKKWVLLLKMKAGYNDDLKRNDTPSQNIVPSNSPAVP